MSVARVIQEEVASRRPHWICGVPERGDRLGIAHVVALRCDIDLTEALSHVDGYFQ